jgi:ligand-binding SRPBCC domain-containing protein
MVDAPIEEVFGFFSKPQNLGVMTPSSMRFRIPSDMPAEIRRGQRIEVRDRLGADSTALARPRSVR